MCTASTAAHRRRLSYRHRHRHLSRLNSAFYCSCWENVESVCVLGRLCLPLLVVGRCRARGARWTNARITVCVGRVCVWMNLDGGGARPCARLVSVGEYNRLKPK